MLFSTSVPMTQDIKQHMDEIITDRKIFGVEIRDSWSDKMSNFGGCYFDFNDLYNNNSTYHSFHDGWMIPDKLRGVCLSDTVGIPYC